MNFKGHYHLPNRWWKILKSTYVHMFKKHLDVSASQELIVQVISKYCFCSVGKRSGHIPYRDSKLTLTLQHSLGDNARTAIICTLSPVSGHVEQSRNTLFFATRAKEVTNNAQVNMVCKKEKDQFLTHGLHVPCKLCIPNKLL